MKAVFQVNLGRVEGMRSLSNMPVRDVGVAIGDTGYVWDVYEYSVGLSIRNTFFEILISSIGKMCIRIITAIRRALNN